MKFSPEQVSDTIISSDDIITQIGKNIGSGFKVYVPIDDNNSRFDLVEIKTTNNCSPTPHCKIHGAMNCVAVHSNGKLWRCIQSNLVKDCRAGCEERKSVDE